MLIVAMLFATSSLVNANVSVEERTASDCVKSSRDAVEALAEEFGWDIHNGGSESEFAVKVFKTIYLDCYNNL